MEVAAPLRAVQTHINRQVLTDQTLALLQDTGWCAFLAITFNIIICNIIIYRLRAHLLEAASTHRCSISGRLS